MRLDTVVTRIRPAPAPNRAATNTGRVGSFRAATDRASTPMAAPVPSPVMSRPNPADPEPSTCLA